MQLWLDSKLSGVTAEQAKLLWVPAGTRYRHSRTPIKDEFDEWLARVVCYAFSLPPTAFVRQIDRGTAAQDRTAGWRRASSP